MSIGEIQTFYVVKTILQTTEIATYGVVILPSFYGLKLAKTQKI